MKKLFIPMLIFYAGVVAEAQPGRTNPGNSPALPVSSPCGTRVEIADSTVNFLYDATTGTYNPVTVTVNFYDDNYNLTTVVSMALPDRTYKFRQLFTYDENNNMIRYVYQIRNNDAWEDNLINERTYSPEGLPVTEVFLRLGTTGAFTEYQRHFYENENGRTTRYLRQVKDASGNWYDFSYHIYVYDDMGRLTVLYGQYISSGLIFWERTALYNFNGKVTDRFLRVLRYNYSLRQNVLTRELHEVSSYNKYGNVIERRNHGYVNNEPFLRDVDSIYYSKLPRKNKVSVCFRGKTLCVSVSQVDILLARGGTLGACPAVPGEEMSLISVNDISVPLSRNIIIYPNPASEQVTVKLGSQDYGELTGYLMSADGRIVRSFIIENRDEMTLDISALRPGTYYLSMTGQKGTFTQTLVIK